ncbi:hypothetical protein MKK88_14080 [Methylobacterium sp. E-005]|uniref:glycosyltransferase family protein n=1 Tax=Methylobacterium sp. E-005 TaxID=2836549 RepID=UPI001FBAA5DA|nr:glycosyltransferase [Methylobacterium sp. E-005]MCJ2087106.1 hypothetical protein [Methylobacterium sp. E-005]
MLPNVSLKKERRLEEYDLFLAHGPLEFAMLSCLLEERGIPRERIIYIAHWALQPDLWVHIYDGVAYEQFVKDVSNSAIVCVSHFQPIQFKFYSHVCVQVIQHFVPDHVFGDPVWEPGGSDFINVVNMFYAPKRGVGSKFWDSLDFVNKKLYGASNGPHSAGVLNSVGEFRDAVSKAAGFLWTADAAPISFAPLEAMLLGCPVIAPRNSDWPALFDDKLNIVLYDEGDYNSCKEAVEYLNHDKRVAKDLSLRGRDAILKMNSAALFRERWSRVIDAAVAAAPRGRRRLAADAAAPLTRVTSVRRSRAESEPYALVTPMSIAGTTVAISHPAETWEIPRQFIHRFATLRHYAPAKHDLALNAARRGGCVFDIARDLGFFGYLCANNGATVRFFNRSKKMMECVRNTITYNKIDRASVVNAVFDDEERETWFSPNNHVIRGDSAGARTEKVKTISLDQYIEKNPEHIPTAIFIDEPSYEARIVQGSRRTIATYKPELIINCYTHGAYARGTPIITLLQTLDDLGYAMQTCNWDGKREDLRSLEGIAAPDQDSFLLHGTVKT